jgi:hypothetical protein
MGPPKTDISVLFMESLTAADCPCLYSWQVCQNGLWPINRCLKPF